MLVFDVILRSLSKCYGQACSGSICWRGYVWDELHRVPREPWGRGLLCAHPITGEPGQQREDDNDAEPWQCPAARWRNRPQQEVRGYLHVYVEARFPKPHLPVVLKPSIFPSETTSYWPSPVRLSLGSASQASSCPTKVITGVTSQHGPNSSRVKHGPKPPVQSPTRSGLTSKKMVGLKDDVNSLLSLSHARAPSCDWYMIRDVIMNGFNCTSGGVLEFTH